MAKANKLSNRDYVAKLGFDYKVVQSVSYNNDALLLQDFRNSLLKDLSEIESAYQELSTVNSSVRIKRNQKLVEILKELYDGQCQLCGASTNIPEIISANGSRYSEVHHINPMSSITSEDDYQEIDTYKNAIVLCPFHHSYVHHHHGGGFSLSANKTELTNEYGDSLPILLDYHLKDTY